MDSIPHAIEIYNTITSEKPKYGVYRKTLFHLHTPASYDYHLLKDWDAEKYKTCPEDKIIEQCYKQEIVPKGMDLKNYDFDGELKSIYSNKKEWLSYLMIAGSLFKNNYEMVLISDHNTLQGIKKLQRAISDYYNAFCKGDKSKAYPKLIYGIEISCADKLHVVGIISTDKITQTETWLEEHILSERDGTYLTSLDVIAYFKNEGGFAYVAHINSANIFQKEKYLSAGYKNKLKEAGCFEFVGIREISQAESVRQLLSNNGIKDSYFLIDNDAHSIEEIENNFFWVKTGKRSFNTLIEALEDYYVSITLKNNKETQKKRIVGLYIEPLEEGFLSGTQGGDAFICRFSDALNCFIGGRGTGKSTVLQILDFALGLRVPNERILEFICRHGNVWILFEVANDEYLINMNMPYNPGHNNILRFFGQNESGNYYFNYRFNSKEIRDYSLKKYLSIYKVREVKGRIQLEKVHGKRAFLDDLFDSQYSVNQLVKTASSEEINTFLRDYMLREKTLSASGKEIRARNKSGIEKAIRGIENILLQRSQLVHDVIDPFNKLQEGIMKIEYSQNRNPDEDPDFCNWIFGTNEIKKGQFENYAITKENVIEYLEYVYRVEGSVFKFLKTALELEQKDNKNYPVDDFCNIKGGKNEPLIDDPKVIKCAIFNRLFENNNIPIIIQYLRRIIGQVEEFRLMFNINSNTASSNKVCYKNVRDVSLGQKVVAMLDFILGFGTHIGDKRPLIIDQPEDNLDSQYIYNNLVEQLRTVKQERQVIIATHNATIVTNAMTDQVCVMNSDGIHGWIEKAGYPSETRIKKSLVDYLEGGVESFNHKIKIYQSVL